MRKAEMVLAVACVALLGACRKSAAPEASPSEPPPAAEAAPEAPAEAPAAEAPAPAAGEVPAVAPPTAQPGHNRIIPLRLGPPPEESPGTFEGGVFRPGAQVTASLDASSLPPGAIVKVSWFDADGAALGEEHKPVTTGMQWLTFTAPGSSGWANGTYRVEFVVSTGGYATESFLIGDISERPTRQPG